MRLFNIVAIFIYTLFFCIIGAVLIALSLRTASFDLVVNFIENISHTDNLRLWIALTGLAFILINISIAQLTIGKLQRHKTIAFENPYGQVTIALSAIEDYIKKLTNKMPEIKEIRSNIIATKTGIEVITKAVLYSEFNIPEITEKIQNSIRLRLQEMLGLEETVTIKVHVTKIIQRDLKGGEHKGQNKQSEPSAFKGEIEYGH